MPVATALPAGCGARVPFRRHPQCRPRGLRKKKPTTFGGREMELRRRRFGGPCASRWDRSLSAETVELLRDELDLAPEDISFHRSPSTWRGGVGGAPLDRPDRRRTVASGNAGAHRRRARRGSRPVLGESAPAT